MQTQPLARSFRGRFVLLSAAIALLASACVSTADSDFPVGAEESTDEATTDEATTDEATNDEAMEGAEGAEGDMVDGLPIGAIAEPWAWASIEEVACSFDEFVPLPTPPTCHALSVPEDWNSPDPDDQVVIQVAVFASDQASEDALIYFDGGPGGYTLDSLSFSYEDRIQPFLGNGDYVFFDQRGVGGSEPELACPEVVEIALADYAGELDPATAQTANLEAQDTCRDRLAGTGVNLAAYNSVASANDVEAMRHLLGYEQFNVFSISYGTRLAQSYMRMYPESNRSVVLDSVFPTGADLWSNFNPGAIRAFEQLFDGCQASSVCSAEFPELKDRFFQLLDQLDTEPAQLEAQNLLTGETVPILVDGDDLMGLVFGALYDRTRYALVPQMVEDGLAGNYEAITFLGSVQVTNLNFVSYGMRLSVECNEEIPFESLEVLEANIPTEPPYDRLATLENELTFFELCDRWPAGVAPDVESMPIESDIPTLLLAGQYDPITPPAGADDVAAGLVNYYSFLMPYEGHGIMTSDCGVQLVNGFVADPGSEPDSSCIAGSPEPPWVPGASGPVELVEFELDGLVAVAGLRPGGWTDAGNGAFVRQQTPLDPTLVVIQPTTGLPADTLVNLLSSQVGVTFEPVDAIDIDGVAWEAFSSAPGSEQAARIAFKPGADGVFVLLQASEEEIDALYDEFFVAVAAAARPN